MDLTGAGTGIMVAIAALLWFLYFVPTWMARREYLDTERTATRLQQTLRIMAETSELPDQVRVEVSARDAARHERVLRAQQRALEHRADVLAARAAASVRAATPAIPRTAAAVSWSREPVTPGELIRLRRRRAHRLASVLMAVATATIGIQLLLVATTGMAIGAWLVFAMGVAVGVAGVSVRRQLDTRSAQSAALTSAYAATPTVERTAAVQREARASGWTPVPVPPPLYLSKPEAQPVVPVVQPGELIAQLRAAALEAEEALRAAHEEPEVTPIRPAWAPTQAPASPVAPSRWAAMGRVGIGESAADAAVPDLDDVLRRRRNVG